MTYEEFALLFSDAVLVRDAFSARMPPWFGHSESRKWPPVIGFGLPSTSQQTPIATLALNPSNREIENECLPDSASASEQWTAQTQYFTRTPLSWFDRSDAFLRAAFGKVHADGVPHLDLSPVVTSRGFDGAYDKLATPDQRTTALAFLKASMEKVLVPLLKLLVESNGLRTLVVYGFVPAGGANGKAGSRTWKEFTKYAGEPFALRKCVPAGKAMLGLGGMRGSFSMLNVVFLSQGPSADGASDRLANAGRLVRELGWGS